jgi:adenylate kinase
MKDLVLFGIQGSGKGTQAKRLAAERGYVIFGAGERLRAIASQDSELGRTVAACINHGNLVPPHVIMDVVRDYVTHTPVSQAILFDGVPRDGEQMVEFDRIMAEAGRSFHGVNLSIPYDEAVARITKRAAEEGRADDVDPDFVRRRLSWFPEKCLPVIEHYREAGIVVDVDGRGPIDEVYQSLVQAIDTLSA